MIDSSRTWTLTARWIFPISEQPLPQGILTIRDEQILAVEPHGVRKPDLDLGNVAVLPGLVNAHTHLDLSGLEGQLLRQGDFTSWLRGVIRHRRNLTPEQVEADICTGLTKSLSEGTTLLGDIAVQGISWAALSQAPLRSVVFYELLGLSEARALQAWANARTWLESVSPRLQERGGYCHLGWSPHAPYSVHASLFRLVAEHACHQRLPVAIHFAESRDEIELLEGRRGSFVAFLQELGVWEPDGFVAGLEDLLTRYESVPCSLWVHGNYCHSPVSVPPGGSIVYCPRTHAAFGHPPHPFREFLTAGIRVALGTDSLASNPDLSVLAEARFLYVLYPDIPGSTLLRMATLAGAEALGRQRETGSLEAGKSADLVVIPLPDEEANDPHQLVLASSLPVRRVMWCGRWRESSECPAAAFS